MSPTRPRTTRQERKRLIEEAATALFARRGYATTTMDDVARAAGFTKPMVYRDFDSKRDLCIALLERHREELIKAALDVFDPAASDRPAQVRRMIGAWMDHVREHPDAVRLLFLPIVGDPEIERVQRELHDRQRATQSALLREFSDAHDPAEAEPLGEVVRASLAALGLWSLDHPDTPREVLVEIMVRVVEGLVGGPIGGRSDDRA